MANILEFLRGVATDPEAQRVFRADPEGFVTRAGFTDLTGEDVVEGIAVVRRALPDGIAAALADFDDDRRIPPVRPAHGERDLDAALRLLTHAVDLVSGDVAPAPVDEAPKPTPFWEAAEQAGSAPPGVDEPVHHEPVHHEPVHDEPVHHEPAHHEPIPVEADPVLADPEPAAEPVVEPPAHPDTPEHHEPLAAEADAPLAVPEPVEAPVAMATAPVGPDPLGDAIRAAAVDVAAVLDDYAAGVRQRLVDEADRFLAEARAEAERARADAEALRAEAEADRDAARKVLAEAHAEAEQIRAQVATGHEQLESRRAELREVERELRERIAGLDSVFRTVLRDDA